LLKHLGGILGLLQQSPEQFLQSTISDLSDKNNIEQLIADRNTARAQKNWAEADRVRKVLLERGIVIEDSPSGTTWRSI
jgi:cysteinyl-tRNA synthetase